MEEANMYYLAKAPVPKAVANMAIPMILGMFVGVIQNLTDTFFIGQLNDANLVAAAMLALPVFTIFMAVSNIFGIGCGTYISRLLGEKDYENVKSTSSFSFYTCLLSGIALTILCLIFMEPILRFIGTSAETLDATRKFVTIIAGGGSLIMLSFSMGQIVRAEGAAKESMVGMLIGTISNIVLDPMMIFGMHLGVAGAAYATVISNGLAVTYYGWYLIKKSQWLSISVKYFRCNLNIVKNSFSIGIPVLINFLLLLASSVALNNYAAGYGDALVAVFGIAIQMNMMPEFIISGLCEGVQPLVGYNYTADRNRMSEIIQFTGIIAVLLSVFITLALYSSSSFVLSMFISNDEIVKIGTPLFRISMIAPLFLGIIFLFTNVFQATGKSIPALVMSLSQGAIFLPALVIGNALYGLEGVAYALPISDFGTAVLAIILYLINRSDLQARNLQATQPDMNQM
ncbi:MATE family efflux transporter [Heliobacillus mobilis]|uniref:Multidrug export protein MepA n=1 Tax=Heliobacterium mobile TaxID=28064 RepID=A0A6I3SN40_HELMO|nr:MATE family efflux transporter [Heliobacterium mobile]MTV49962.1 MATE family efflux transporter [Heliobacterium mobile]